MVTQVLYHMGHRLNIHDLLGNQNEDPSDYIPNCNDIRASLLLRLGLCLLVLAYTALECRKCIFSTTNTFDESRSKLPLQAQIKSVRVVGTRLLVYLFSSTALNRIQFWSLNDHSEAVRMVCTSADVLSHLKESSSIYSSNLVIELALLWSENVQLTQFFLVNTQVLDVLVDLMGRPIGKKCVKKDPVVEKILCIIINLIYLSGKFF